MCLYVQVIVTLIQSTLEGEKKKLLSLDLLKLHYENLSVHCHLASLLCTFLRRLWFDLFFFFFS